MESYSIEVKKGQMVLLKVLAPYIAKTMYAIHGDGWWPKIYYSASELARRNMPVTGKYDDLVASMDLACCLHNFCKEYSSTFSALPRNCRNWASELIDVRNKISHEGVNDCSQEYAERALDTMALFADAIDKKAGEELRAIYREVRYADELIPTAEYELPNGPTAIDIPVSWSAGDYSEGAAIDLLSYVGTELVQCTTLSRKITFNGETKSYPVYKVRLDTLYYNDQNDRIGTWVSRYIAEHGDDAFYKLSCIEYNAIIEQFIYESSPEENDNTQRNIDLFGQREPGVTLADGRIVDGNRRYTCLRRLSRKKNEPLYFETVIMDADLSRDKKQIKLLELSIQHGEEKKVEYDLIAKATGTYKVIERDQLVTIEEYAASTNEKIAEVKERLELAHLVNEFLENIGLPWQYHIAKDYQVYSVFKESASALKALSEEDRGTLKKILFDNIIMKAVKDQKRMVRDMKSLVGDKAYRSFFDEMEVLDKKLHDKYDEADIRSKDDIEKFAQENADWTEKMQTAINHALHNYRNQQVVSQPSESVKKCITIFKDIDSRLFGRLGEEDKKELSDQLDVLIKMAGKYKSVLEKN